MVAEEATTVVEFFGVYHPDDGWLVLSPWIKTPDGKAYRHVTLNAGDHPTSEGVARYLADQLNKAVQRKPGG